MSIQQSSNEVTRAHASFLGGMILVIIIFFGSIAGIVLIKADDRKILKLNKSCKSHLSYLSCLPSNFLTYFAYRMHM
jgi:hypothetical protein